MNNQNLRRPGSRVSQAIPAAARSGRRWTLIRAFRTLARHLGVAVRYGASRRPRRSPP